MIKKIIIRLLEIALFDRRPGKRWQIESIPSTMHYKNVRAVLTATQWKKLATYTHNKAGNRCEQCGSRSNLECHEKWSYDITNKTTANYSPQTQTYNYKGRNYTTTRKVGVMKLVALVSLCKMCHYSKHPNFARRMKSWKYTKAHIKRVFKLNSLRFNLSLYRDSEKQKLLNKFAYRLDLTLLNSPEYAFVVESFGRHFTTNETNSCRKTKINS